MGLGVTLLGYRRPTTTRHTQVREKGVSNALHTVPHKRYFILKNTPHPLCFSTVFHTTPPFAKHPPSSFVFLDPPGGIYFLVVFGCWRNGLAP